MNNNDIEELKRKAEAYDSMAKKLEEMQPVLKRIHAQQITDLSSILLEQEETIRETLRRLQTCYPEESIEVVAERIHSFLRILFIVKSGTSHTE